MTLSTSAVAVCCSSDSRSSPSSRVFSMAITAWSAKVVASSICLSVNACTTLRSRISTPMGIPSRISGTPRIVCECATFARRTVSSSGSVWASTT